MPLELQKAALGLMLMLALIRPAASHSWYEGARDPVTGESCCGGIDCREINDEDVREAPGGAFRYLPTGELIPASRVQQSHDWRFHRCEYLGTIMYGGKLYPKGSTRCFFAPPGSF